MAPTYFLRALSVAALATVCATALAQTASVTLTPDSACYAPGETVTVTVELSDVIGVDSVIGGRFRVTFDSSLLTYQSAGPAPTVFTELLSLVVDGENIDIQVGVNPDPPGSGALTGTMAVFTFTAAAEVCSATAAVAFQLDAPPNRTRLSALLQGDPVAIQGASLTRVDLATISTDVTPPALMFAGPETFASDTSSLWEAVTWSGFVCPNVIGATPNAAAPSWDPGAFVSATIPNIDCDPSQVGDTTFACLRTMAALDLGGTYDSVLLGDLTGRTLSLRARFATNLPDGTPLTAADFLDLYGPATTYSPGVSVYFVDGLGDRFHYLGSQPGIDNYLDATQMLSGQWRGLLVDFGDYTKWSDANGDPVTALAFAAAVADVAELCIAATGGDAPAGQMAFTGATTGAIDFDFIVSHAQTIASPADAGVCYATLALPGSAVDDCDANATNAYTVGGTPITSPYDFPVGTTVVDVSAVDACGNASSWSFSVVVTDEQVPVTGGVVVAGGNLDGTCAGTVTFDATIDDNCCLEPDDVVVDVQLVAGTANLGTPTIIKTGSGSVAVNGEVAVSNVTTCSATVQVAIFATDCHQNAMGTAGTAPADGAWSESYAGGAAEAPGNVLHMFDAAQSQWALSGPTLESATLIEDTVDGNGNGVRVYRSVYLGGTLAIDAALWGGSGSVTADVVRHVHMTHYVYVSNVIDDAASWIDLHTHAVVAGDVGVTLTGRATFVGNGAAPPGGYPAFLGDDSFGGRWGDLSQLALSTVELHTAAVADATAPAVSDCPQAISVNADAGGCTANVTWPVPTVVDNCDAAPLVEYLVDLGDDAVIDATITETSYVFPVGTHSVTVRATDACSNVDDTQCAFAVAVAAQNTLIADIELDGALTGTSFTRCLTFWVVDCQGQTTTFDQEATFVDGAVMGLSLSVDCGDYECVMVADGLHSLRRRIDRGGRLTVVGGAYVADFTGTARLIQGDLYDDIPLDGRDVIDILDFAVYIARWGYVYAAADCNTAFPHADINGDGVVDVSDFSFIQLNILAMGDVSCCALATGGGGPLTTITLAELIDMGLEDLVVADLNEDGVIDFSDIAAFMGGTVPDFRGDLNCDGTVDFDDIDAFVLALTDAEAYAQSYACGRQRADINGDGNVDFNDIDPFVALLSQP